AREPISKNANAGPRKRDPALTPCRANRLLLLIGRFRRGVPRRVVGVVRVRRLRLHGVGTRAVARRRALLVHRLLAGLAHHLDLLGAIRGRIEARAHLRPLADRGEIAGAGPAAVDDLGLVVDRQGDAVALARADDEALAVRIDLRHAADRRLQVRHAARRRAAIHRPARAGGARRGVALGGAALAGRRAGAAERAAARARAGAALAGGGPAHAAGAGARATRAGVRIVLAGRRPGGTGAALPVRRAARTGAALAVGRAARTGAALPIGRAARTGAALAIRRAARAARTGARAARAGARVGLVGGRRRRVRLAAAVIAHRRGARRRTGVRRRAARG